MRIAGTMAIAAALIGAAASADAGDRKEPEQDCGVTTVEMVECLNAKTGHWDNRLNAAYQKVLKGAEPRQREQMRKAQRLWVQYRDANCLYWALGEGTIARIEAADCVYRMTRSRADELEGAAARN